jgi:hypothetical protein
VVGVQDLCQAASPAYLCALSLGNLPVVARELQPVEDKVALPPLARRLELFGDTLEAMAHLAAFAQLRSAARLGAAAAEELIDFGQELLAHPAPWVDAARAVDAANSAAFAKFQAAWRGGDPRLHALVPKSAIAKAAPGAKRARATDRAPQSAATRKEGGKEGGAQAPRTGLQGKKAKPRKASKPAPRKAAPGRVESRKK